MEDSKKEASRRKSLGELGELIAIKALVDGGFDKIKNLNDKKINTAYADLYCEKDGKKYIISVKARNKFGNDGKLNSKYNLLSKDYENARKAEKYHDAEAYWMAIPFEKTTFTVYFGSLKELNSIKGIPIRHCENGTIGKRMGNKDQRHYFDWDFFTNKK